MSDHNKMLIDRIKGVLSQPGPADCPQCVELSGMLEEALKDTEDYMDILKEMDRLRDENAMLDDEIDRLRAENAELKELEK